MDEKRLEALERRVAELELKLSVPAIAITFGFKSTIGQGDALTISAENQGILPVNITDFIVCPDDAAPANVDGPNPRLDATGQGDQHTPQPPATFATREPRTYRAAWGRENVPFLSDLWPCRVRETIQNPRAELICKTAHNQRSHGGHPSSCLRS